MLRHLCVLFCFFIGPCELILLLGSSPETFWKKKIWQKMIHLFFIIPITVFNLSFSVTTDDVLCMCEKYQTEPKHRWNRRDLTADLTQISLIGCLNLLSRLERSQLRSRFFIPFCLFFIRTMHSISRTKEATVRHLLTALICIWKMGERFNPLLKAGQRERPLGYFTFTFASLSRHSCPEELPEMLCSVYHEH